MKKKKPTHEETTIIGFVDPLDDDDDSSGVMISTENEEYVVDMNTVGEKLLQMIDEEVQVTGRVSIAKDGTKSISVRHFDYAPFSGEDADDE